MKKVFLILLLFSAFSVQASRRCLLIGVGHYPAGSGWRPINSVNDIRLLDSSLAKTWTVSTLCDKEATYDGICKAMDALIMQTNAGDTVLVHFSGHGQQMLTNDPQEADHLDEAFAPYDAKAEDSGSYHGQSHLRDNMLAAFVSKLRNKISSNGLLIVTMDDCHSGSMNRREKGDSLIYRGISDIFGQNTIGADSLLKITRSSKNENRDVIENLPNGSDVIFLSACKANEKNREIEKSGVHYGPLSYAIAVAYRETDMNNIKRFLDSVHSHMEEYVPFQTPQTINNINYKFPVDTTRICTGCPEPDNHHCNLITLLIVIVVSLLIAILIWKKIKK